MNENTIVGGLIEEMVKEEVAANEAAAEFNAVRVKYEVALRKYAAIRDAAESVLGKSPYAPDVKWPYDAQALEIQALPRPGRFRFVYKPVGEAVMSVLMEAEQPLTLEAISESLKLGSAAATPRAVNATVTNNNRVEKLEDGRYRYVAPEPSAEDDSPWE